MAVMKTLELRRLPLARVAARDVPRLLARAGVEYHSVAENNWPAAFPYTPVVQVAAALADDALLLHYRVREKDCMANVVQDHGHVWEDSCVECFLAVGEVYYNIECNCLGVLHLAAGPGRRGREYAPADVMAGVGRWSSLRGEVSVGTDGQLLSRPLNNPGTSAGPTSRLSAGPMTGLPGNPEVPSGEETEWEIALTLPFECFFQSRETLSEALSPSAQVLGTPAPALRGNFYKCGGHGPLEHYLSWSPIATERPDFHRPEFFAPFQVL